MRAHPAGKLGEGATARYAATTGLTCIAIHAPREGGDDSYGHIGTGYKDFIPRPPRGGRRRRYPHAVQLPEISIHAPREGGDLHQRRPTQRRADFNPRPREGGDGRQGGGQIALVISIHAPREGGRRRSVSFFFPVSSISIHAPREGGDRQQQTAGRHGDILIHAPARGRQDRPTSDRLPSIFQSTPPRGGRPPLTCTIGRFQSFQSTPPRGGATVSPRRQRASSSACV